MKRHISLLLKKLIKNTKIQASNNEMKEKLTLAVGMRQFRQQNYWNNRNTKATSKMLAK